MSGANVFSIEEQARLAAEGIRVRGGSRPARLSQRYGRELERLAAAERELARASVKWNKLRLSVRRLDRELDKLAAEGAEL